MNAFLAYSYSNVWQSELENYIAQNKLYNRRLIKKLNFIKFEQEAVQFQKFSMICFFGTSGLDFSLTQEQELVQLFLIIIVW